MSGNLTRPNFGQGPVFIKFRPYLKNLYDIDVAKSHFTADLVLTYEWADEAAVQAVMPSGVKQLTIPLDRAKERLWLPDMVVSNRVGSSQLISSSVMVTDEGLVRKVDRVVAQVLVPFHRESFPFDSQDLYVNVASSAYMAHDLKMLPMEVPNISSPSSSGTWSDTASNDTPGSNETPFSGLTDASIMAYMRDPRALYAKLEIFSNEEYALRDVSVTTYDDSDSTLHKSRGRLTVKVRHRYFGFLIGSFLPVLFLQVVAAGCFFFPVAGAFAMPRTATVLVPQLAAIIFASRLSALMPYDNSVTWIEVFNAVVQIQMFAFMCLNLACMHAAHNLKAPDVALRMNEECKLIVVPLCLIVNGLLLLQPMLRLPVPWHAGIMALAVIASYGAVTARIFAQMPRLPRLHDQFPTPC